MFLGTGTSPPIAGVLRIETINKFKHEARRLQMHTLVADAARNDFSLENPP